MHTVSMAERGQLVPADFDFGQQDFNRATGQIVATAGTAAYNHMRNHRNFWWEQYAYDQYNKAMEYAQQKAYELGQHARNKFEQWRTATPGWRSHHRPRHRHRLALPAPGKRGTVGSVQKSNYKVVQRHVPGGRRQYTHYRRRRRYRQPYRKVFRKR